MSALQLGEDSVGAPRFRVRFVLTAGVVLCAVASAGALALTGSSAITETGAADAHSAQASLAPERAARATTATRRTPDTTSNPGILAPADVIVGESDGHVDLTVRLSDQGDNPVTVHYATANATAFASTAATSTTWPPRGPHIRTGRDDEDVPVRSSTARRRRLQLVHVQPERLGQRRDLAGRTRISIVDNDTLVATPRLFVRDATVDEKDGTAIVPVFLGGPWPGLQQHGHRRLRDRNGTATAGRLHGRSGTLTFAPGRDREDVVVPITDDATAEPRTSRSPSPTPTPRSPTAPGRS